MSKESDLEVRIAQLEAQNEAIKRVGTIFVVFILIAATLTVFQFHQFSAAVHTETLQLEQDGRPKAALTTMPTGHLGLVFYDHLGILPLDIKYGGIPYLDGIAFYDRNGDARILIGINDKDEPILAVVDSQGKTLFQAVPLESDEAGSAAVRSEEPESEPGAVANPPTPLSPATDS